MIIQYITIRGNYRYTEILSSPFQALNENSIRRYQNLYSVCKKNNSTFALATAWDRTRNDYSFALGPGEPVLVLAARL